MLEAPAPKDAAGALPLCPSAALAEGGRAHVFEVKLWRSQARAFALRFDGGVFAYLNRCAHVPTEMDYEPGRFLDESGRYIVCPFHGAAYEPDTGLCVSGPCRGQRLMAIDVAERGGQVYWYPSDDVRACPPAPSPEPAPPTSASPHP